MRQMILKLFCLALIWGLSVPALAEKPPPSNPEPSTLKVGGVRSLEDRVKQLEEAIGRTPESNKWYDRIQVSGLVVIEASYQEIDYRDEGQEDEKKQ